MASPRYESIDTDDDERRPNNMLRLRSQASLTMRRLLAVYQQNQKSILTAALLATIVSAAFIFWLPSINRLDGIRGYCKYSKFNGRLLFFPEIRSGFRVKPTLSWLFSFASGILLLTQHELLIYGISGPLTREEVGHATWSLLHTMAAKFPANVTEAEQDDYRQFLHILSRLFPCAECSGHFQVEFGLFVI
jgi:hypothetical protein